MAARPRAAAPLAHSALYLAFSTPFQVRVLPPEERTLVIFCSRGGERSRAVANEPEVVSALAQAVSPLGLEVVVHRRGLSAGDSIALFQRARMVVGPHGAGLSHIVFCAPGTAVLELAFVRSPPMMFWHISAALGLPYSLAPLPRSFWGQPSKVADAAEVVALALRSLSASPSSTSSTPVPAAPSSAASGAGGGLSDMQQAVPTPSADDVRACLTRGASCFGRRANFFSRETFGERSLY